MQTISNTIVTQSEYDCERDAPYRIKLGNRLFMTTKREIHKIVRVLWDRVSKGSDIPRLLEENKYLFKECDPILKQPDELVQKDMSSR